jgi:hypothetical protein
LFQFCTDSVDYHPHHLVWIGRDEFPTVYWPWRGIQTRQSVHYPPFCKNKLLNVKYDI